MRVNEPRVAVRGDVGIDVESHRHQHALMPGCSTCSVEAETVDLGEKPARLEMARRCRTGRAGHWRGRWGCRPRRRPARSRRCAIVHRGVRRA